MPLDCAWYLRAPQAPLSEHTLSPPWGGQVTPQLFNRLPSLPDLLDAHLWSSFAFRAWQDAELLEIRIRAVWGCLFHTIGSSQRTFPPGYGEQTLLGSGGATGQTGPAPCAWISSASLLCNVLHDFSALMSSSLQEQSKSNSVLQTRGSCCPSSAFWIMSCQQSKAQSNSKYPKKCCQPWASCWAAKLVCVGSCKTAQGKPQPNSGWAGQAALSTGCRSEDVTEQKAEAAIAAVLTFLMGSQVEDEQMTCGNHYLSKSWRAEFDEGDCSWGCVREGKGLT